MRKKGIKSITANAIVNIVLDWKLNKVTSERAMIDLYQLLLVKCIIEKDLRENSNRLSPYTVMDECEPVDGKY